MCLTLLCVVLCPVSCVLQLPRHKSVVVSLNDSDDSDSDVDACSSTQTVFGGLEFMIKEARRTVEVRHLFRELNNTMDMAVPFCL